MWYTNAIRGRICGIDQVPLTFVSLYMDQKVLFAEGDGDFSPVQEFWLERYFAWQ